MPGTVLISLCKILFHTQYKKNVDSTQVNLPKLTTYMQKSESHPCGLLILILRSSELSLSD